MPTKVKKITKKVPLIYAIKYRRNVTLGASIEEELVVKEDDMVTLVAILHNNGYLITSIKLLTPLSMEDK